MKNICYRALVLTLSLLLMISCGDSEDSTVGITPSVAEPTKNTSFTVIDGYIYQAEIYSDKNLDDQATSDEIQGITDEKGKILLSEDSLNYPTIVKIIPHVSNDSDIAGALTKPKELIADKDQRIISPFSTLAFIQSKDLSQLAAELGLETSRIDTDYIAQQYQDSHIIARSIMQLFEQTIEQSIINSERINSDSMLFAKYVIDNNVQDKKWDDKILILDGDGEVKEKKITEVVSTQFNFSTSKIRWLISDFSQYPIENNENKPFFSPNFVDLIDDDTAIVAHIHGFYFLTISLKDGAILNSLKLTTEMLSTESTWFIDNGVLVVYLNDELTFYDSELKPLASHEFTQSAFLSPNYFNSYIGIPYLSNTIHVYGTVPGSGIAIAEDIVSHQYDQNGNLFIQYKNGTSKPILVAREKIQDDVVSAHNKMNYKECIATTENTISRFVTENIFWVSVYPCSSSSSQHNYQYFYYADLESDGKTTPSSKVVPLGSFNLGKRWGAYGRWGKGLDSTTVTYHERESETPHFFHQFSISTGEKITTYSIPSDMLNRDMYHSIHTKHGIIGFGADDDLRYAVFLIK